MGYGADGRYGWYGVYVMERRQVKMPEELWVAIGEAAHDERISRSEWVRRACEKDLSDEPFKVSAQEDLRLLGLRPDPDPRVEAPARGRVSRSEHDATVEAVFFPEHHVHDFKYVPSISRRRCECGEIQK